MKRDFSKFDWLWNCSGSYYTWWEKKNLSEVSKDGVNCINWITYILAIYKLSFLWIVTMKANTVPEPYHASFLVLRTTVLHNIWVWILLPFSVCALKMGATILSLEVPALQGRTNPNHASRCQSTNVIDASENCFNLQISRIKGESPETSQ